VSGLAPLGEAPKALPAVYLTQVLS
jgi:hypothetical protein